MKSFTNFALALLFLLAIPSVSKAQTQTNIPFTNSNFEEWSTGNGYSVAMGMLSIYSSFTYPSNWNYPSFPLDYPISFGGMSLNINTDLPLLKVSKETSNVPEGNYALKMQSFKLSDIISSTAYSIFQSFLDSELTDMVIPTFLSTGEINLEQLLTLITSISDNMEDPTQLLESLNEIDMNEYITGGIPLNGQVPGRLTGQYKYISATSGDNGAVMLLGTKYNNDTHRREVVGGGFSMDLTDNANYTSFEVVYNSLNDLLPDGLVSDPDTMVIILCSSANVDNRQQGSALYVDNLQLWTSDGNSIPLLEEDKMLCYPNPANGQCQLQFQQKPLSIKLYSIDGKLLQQTTPLTENITLDLPYKGIFILQCETDQGSFSKKIVNQ
jgi:hypothetical protein